MKNYSALLRRRPNKVCKEGVSQKAKQASFECYIF